MAGFKSGEKRDGHGRWSAYGSAIRNVPTSVREKLTGVGDARPIGEVLKGAMMHNRWAKEERSYAVKVDPRVDKKFLSALEREQNKSLMEKQFAVNHPVKAAARTGFSALGRAIGRGFTTSRTKGK